MSTLDQCPTKHDAPRTGAPAPRRAQGREYWRSLDELADTQEFRDFLEREFPAHASELTEPSRRSFLKVMGASLALAGAATVPGCRRPERPIVPYARDPEHVIPGKPLFVATAMPRRGGGAEGLLVETHTGRPTKIEGNPLHPVNRGKSSVESQASVLNLYDPDRLQRVTRMGDRARVESTWDEFDAWAAGHFAQFDARRGRGLFFLVDKQGGPSRDAVRSALLRRWPEARWLPYEPVDDESGLEGSVIALGAPHVARHALEHAKVIVSLDADFLGGESASLADIRGFAAGRRVLTTHGEGSKMNRLYVVESCTSITGAAADHRLRAKPSDALVLALALCERVLARGGSGAPARQLWETLNRGLQASEGGADRHAEWIAAAADDLYEHRGECAILAGPNMPPLVRALVLAANESLGNLGKTVILSPATGDASQSSVASITLLADAVRSAQVDTLVLVGTNPVYDAPADLEFGALLASVPTTICLDVNDTESGAAATWQAPRAHFLESWGDAVAEDGTLSVVQPMIEPLFGGRTDLEFVARLAGEQATNPYEVVRATWRGGPLSGAADFERAWRKTLHDGFLAVSATPAEAPPVRHGSITIAIETFEPVEVEAGGLEVVFRPCPKIRDGRDANNGWLQELPDPVTKNTWDNPALVSPATARRLGLRVGQGQIGMHTGHMARVTVAGRSVEVPTWVSPGVADDTIVLTLGYGRTRSGRVGTGAGFDSYKARSVAAMRTGACTLERAEGSVQIASTQHHWSLEERTIYREVDVQAWRAYGDERFRSMDAYGNERDLNFARNLGEESHVPVNRSVYLPKQQWDYSVGPQWGMSIDLSTCIGCGACTVACQAENNIPVVGKSQVLNGREMHWIRVDRYYVGDPQGDVGVVTQPVPCMHCENAPCETVCPVNATVHGPEGLNHMAYNRCIGTRYCANNCPYKVRRFNYFAYSLTRLNGDWIGKKTLGGVIKDPHLVPPTMREQIEDGSGVVQTMQSNPDVTIRSRGVMEKCTYCVQRIMEATSDLKTAGRFGKDASGAPTAAAIPDGHFQSACQQACPAGAIEFGDIVDPESRVRKMRDHGRTYAMLEYLNVKPRTTYMVRLRNPNPRIREPHMDIFLHGADHAAPHDDAGGAHGETHSDAGVRMRLPVLPDRRRAAVSILSSVGGLS